MIKVIALKSFLYDTEIKTTDSPPFSIKHYDLIELKELGLVEEFIEESEPQEEATIGTDKEVEEPKTSIQPEETTSPIATATKGK